MAVLVQDDAAPTLEPNIATPAPCEDRILFRLSDAVHFSGGVEINGVVMDVIEEDIEIKIGWDGFLRLLP